MTPLSALPLPLHLLVVAVLQLLLIWAVYPSALWLISVGLVLMGLVTVAVRVPTSAQWPVLLSTAVTALGVAGGIDAPCAQGVSSLAVVGLTGWAVARLRQGSRSAASAPARLS